MNENDSYMRKIFASSISPCENVRSNSFYFFFAEKIRGARKLVENPALVESLPVTLPQFGFIFQLRPNLTFKESDIVVCLQRTMGDDVSLIQNRCLK